MELLILLYLLALTGYVIYLRFETVPSVKHETEDIISETKDETLRAIKKAKSDILEALSLYNSAVDDLSGKAEETAVDILSGIERNYQRTGQIQEQLQENALAGAASMDKFNSGLANIFGYDPYEALRKGRETTTE